jgi:hypothetical protein
MAEKSYSYPDKLGYGETFMFHIRVMSSELATDGLDAEFEDLIDMAGWLLRPYLEEEGKWEQWEEISKHGVEIIKTDIMSWGIAKRFRCAEKMGLIMGVAKDMGLLIKRVGKFNADMEYYNDLSGGDDTG